MKQQTEQTGIKIRKSEFYRDSKIILPIDEKRLKDFNDMQTIEISKEELNKIGEHRWLIKEK